jgi:hypothetical protein
VLRRTPPSIRETRRWREESLDKLGDGAIFEYSHCVHLFFTLIAETPATNGDWGSSHQRMAADNKRSV